MKHEEKLFHYFTEHPDKWHTHRDIIEGINENYNPNKCRIELRLMTQIDLLQKKQVRDDRGNQVKVWKTKAL